MKRLNLDLLALLCLLLLGTAYAVVLVTLTIPGNIRVENPSLSSTPSSLDWGTVTVNATHGATVSASLSIQNTGQIPLTITYSCQCQGLSLVLTPFPGTLTPGQTWTGQAILTVPAGTLAGTYNPELTIRGS